MQALILVDIQNDFLPGGALEVPDGDEIISVANDAQQFFSIIVASQDWHPQIHKSFASQHAGKTIHEIVQLGGLKQTLWPDHCVQGTSGADFPESLNQSRFTNVVHKGTNPVIDSYSAFFDNGRRQSTGLHEYLQEENVESVFIMGLAIDYCVLYTAMDAVSLGYKTWLIKDGCRGVDLVAGDILRAMDKMKRAGVKMIHNIDLPIEEPAEA